MRNRVRVSSEPSRREAAAPGCGPSSDRARFSRSRCARVASFAFHASSRARLMLGRALCGRCPSTFRRLCTGHRWMSARSRLSLRRWDRTTPDARPRALAPGQLPRKSSSRRRGTSSGSISPSARSRHRPSSCVRVPRPCGSNECDGPKRPSVATVAQTEHPLGSRRRNRSPRKSRDETGPENAALSAPPGRLVLHPTPAKPRKLGRKPALVSSLSRLARLLGGGGSPERTGLVPSMRLLPLVGRPENSRDFVRRGWTK